MRSAEHLECRSARRQRSARPLRGLADGHARRQARPAAGNPAHGAFVRSMHGLRRPRGRCDETRAGPDQGRVRAIMSDHVDVVDLRWPPKVRIYVWELPVRVTHWLIFFSVLILSATGYYLGDPFITVPGPAKDHFVMGTARAIHLYAAIVFTLAVLVRIYW